MHFISRLGLGLALSLIAGLSAPLIAPVVLSNATTSNRFAGSLVQTQTVQAQTTQAQTPAFSDVPADYWAHDYIQGLAKSNVISGFGDGTFRPNEPVTRAQFAAILRQAFLQSQPTTAQAFKDVPANYWAANAIASARSAGFLSGYPDNTFKPNDRILRVQALVSLANGLKYSAGNSQDLSSYKDADAVPAYARPSTAAAAQANLVVSYPAPDQISPNRAASRAEVAAFVYQALVKAGRIDPIAMKPEKRWQVTPITTITTGFLSSMSLSESGQRLAAIASPGSATQVQVWNTQTGSLLRTVAIDTPDSGFMAIAISKDGTKIAFVREIPTATALVYEQKLTVQTVEDGKVLLTKIVNPPKSQTPNPNYRIRGSFNLVFSPDDKEIITHDRTAELDGSAINVYSHLNFYNIATGKFTQSIALIPPTDEGRLIEPTLSPDGSLVAVITDSGSDYSNMETVNIWQRNNNNRFDYLTALPISKDGVASVAMAFTNSNLLNLTTSRSNQPVLDTWNPQTGEQVQSTMLPDEQCFQQGNVPPSPDGISYFSNYPGLVSCLGNIQTGKFQRNQDGTSDSLETGVFSGNGNVIAVAGDPEIRIFTKAAP